MADPRLPGAARRIGRIVRRAVAAVADRVAAVVRRRPADPRLEGVDPALARYVAAHDPVWFAMEIPHGGTASDEAAGWPAASLPAAPSATRERGARRARAGDATAPWRPDRPGSVPASDADPLPPRDRSHETAGGSDAAGPADPHRTARLGRTVRARRTATATAPASPAPPRRTEERADAPPAGREEAASGSRQAPHAGHSTTAPASARSLPAAAAPTRPRAAHSSARLALGRAVAGASPSLPAVAIDGGSGHTARPASARPWPSIPPSSVVRVVLPGAVGEPAPRPTVAAHSRAVPDAAPAPWPDLPPRPPERADRTLPVATADDVLVVEQRSA